MQSPRDPPQMEHLYDDISWSKTDFSSRETTFNNEEFVSRNKHAVCASQPSSEGGERSVQSDARSKNCIIPPDRPHKSHSASSTLSYS